MAKTSGELMALFEIGIKKSQDQKDIHCPLCNELMENTGCDSFLCYGDHDAWIESHREKAFIANVDNHEIVFYIDISLSKPRRGSQYNPELQGAILAMTENQDLVMFIRGGQGKTRLSLQYKDINKLPESEDWIWMDWTK